MRGIFYSGFTFKKQKVYLTYSYTLNLYESKVSLFPLNLADTADSEDNKRVNGEAETREILGW